MPATRQFDNPNLITALSGWADSYLYQNMVMGNHGLGQQIKIIQTFPFRMETIRNMCKIFWNSELDIGLWGGIYKILHVTVSGTIDGTFFYINEVEIHEATSFLLDLYVTVFMRATAEERENDQALRDLEFARDKLLKAFKDQAHDKGGSGANALDLLNKAISDRLLTNDMIRLEFLLQSLPGALVNERTPLNILNDDKLSNLRNGRISIDESIRRILSFRLRIRDPHLAYNEELVTPVDEEYQLEDNYRNTRHEGAFAYTYDMPERRRRRRNQPPPQVVPRYNLRPRRHINYGPYFRRQWRQRVGRGGNPVMVEIHDMLMNYLDTLF